MIGRPAIMEPAAVLDFFLPDTSIACLEPLTQGNINDTWRVEVTGGRHLVLQRLHPEVFTDPGMVMANVRTVTNHLSRGKHPDLAFFQLVRNPQGQDHCFDTTGKCWRLLTYIENSRTLVRVRTPLQAETIGSLLGRFHLLTADLNPHALDDPLPDFHITPTYLAHYDGLATSEQPASEGERFCRDLIEALRPTVSLLEEARGELSFRVIHGDPKAANFLFAEDEDRAISLIDFDTVKPGLLLHDLGDCLRSCCNPLGEAPLDPEATAFDPELFQSLLAGYLAQAGHLLTAGDRELLVEATALISFELGLRFFTDHLAGDRYFKVGSRGDNLHRALVQFHLHRSITAQREDLDQRLTFLLR
jgi:hypothetical protein